MTMTLTIDNKDYQFKFGIRFVYKMDAKQVIEQDDIKLGAGLYLAMIKIFQMGMDSANALIDLLMTANKVSGGATVKQSDLENYLDDLEPEDYDEFMNDLREELSHGNFTKQAYEKMMSKTEENPK